MSLTLVKCSCNHEFQDKMYGSGNRVANETKDGQYRCTVCSTVHRSDDLVGASRKTAATPVTAGAAVKSPDKKVISKKEAAKNDSNKGKKKDSDKKDTEKHGKKKPKKASTKGGKR